MNVCMPACACIVPHFTSLSNCGSVSFTIYQYSLARPAAQGCLSARRRLYVHVPFCSDWWVMKNVWDSRFKWAPWGLVNMCPVCRPLAFRCGLSWECGWQLFPELNIIYGQCFSLLWSTELLLELIFSLNLLSLPFIPGLTHLVCSGEWRMGPRRRIVL